MMKLFGILVIVVAYFASCQGEAWLGMYECWLTPYS